MDSAVTTSRIRHEHEDNEDEAHTLMATIYAWSSWLWSHIRPAIITPEIPRGETVQTKVQDLAGGWGFETFAFVAKTLDSVDIPNVLWGNMLLRLYGVPTIVDGALFVVSDDRLSDAVSVLISAGFTACEDPSCDVTSPQRRSPMPVEHLHLSTSKDVLGLSKHSDMLWRLKSLNPPSHEIGPEHDILYASDSSLPEKGIGKGCGPFPTELHPVRIPAIHRYTEAVILLRMKHRGDTQGSFWAVMLTYIDSYVCCDGRLNCDLLPPPLRRFMHNRQVGGLTMRETLDILEKELTSEGGLDSS